MQAEMDIPGVQTGEWLLQVLVAPCPGHSKVTPPSHGPALPLPLLHLGGVGCLFGVSWQLFTPI